MTESVKNFSASIQARLKIETTFKKRDTELPTERPVALTLEFASKNRMSWSNFLKKMNLENARRNDFGNVIEKVWAFLQYPLQASINKTKSTYRWLPQKGWK